VVQERPEAVGEALVALDREPAELERHDPDEQVRQHEHRHRETEHREAHQRAVEPAAEAPGGDDAEGHRDQHRDEDGERGERKRGLDALGDELGDLHLVEVGAAELPLQQVARPDAELHRDRAIQPETRADLGDLLAARGVAREDRRGIARRQPQHEEDQHRHDEQDRDRRQQPPGDECVHRKKRPLAGPSFRSPSG
jgi:hypothetical protein